MFERSMADTHTHLCTHTHTYICVCIFPLYILLKCVGWWYDSTEYVHSFTTLLCMKSSLALLHTIDFLPILSVIEPIWKRTKEYAWYNPLLPSSKILYEWSRKVECFPIRFPLACWFLLMRYKIDRYYSHPIYVIDCIEYY